VPSPSIRCILIVEDNQNDAENLLRALDTASLPAKRVIVKSIAEITAYFDKAAQDNSGEFPLPDVLFLNPILPDGNALFVLRGLKQMARRPFVTAVVSAGQEVKKIRDAYQAGADTFLSKPVRPIDLINFFRFQGLASAPATRDFTAMWRSRFCPAVLRAIPIGWRDSSARRECLRR